MQTTDTLDGLLYKVTSMFTDLNNTISAMTLEKSTLNNVIDDLNNKITDITLEKLQLNNVIDDLNKKIIASNFKYDNDIELLSNKLTVKQEEFNDLPFSRNIREVELYQEEEEGEEWKTYDN